MYHFYVYIYLSHLEWQLFEKEYHHWHLEYSHQLQPEPKIKIKVQLMHLKSLQQINSSRKLFRKSGNSKWRQYILAAAVPAKSWVNFKKVAGSIPHRSTLGHANCKNLESLVHFFLSVGLFPNLHSLPPQDCWLLFHILTANWKTATLTPTFCQKLKWKLKKVL